tara:strand:- start:8560 stop:8961 length:402 start_codon:yes stop_codon:yes gene_type:complete
MAKSSSNRNNQSSDEILRLYKESNDKDVSDLKKAIEKLEEEVFTEIEETHNHIETLEATLHSKLDGMDTVLRGDKDYAGLIEQQRWSTLKIRVISISIVLLLGFKIFDMGLDDILKQWFVPEPKTVVRQKTTQ